MDKLETSKRSKDCIELHTNPQIVTVDSPLQGVYDFTFDMVFDEYASQEDVYNECLSDVPCRIMNGVDCTVLAHGQSGTGKTHTMMGQGQGIEMAIRSAATGEGESAVSPMADQGALDCAQSEGMIPRTVAALFEEIRNQPKSVQCVVRCSYVEIYIEKIYDLLKPSSKDVHLAEGEDGEFSLTDAAEICCLEPKDIYALVARGDAYRKLSATKQNEDFGRSHAVLQIKVEQINRSTGTHRGSRLLMLDLAGSEQGRTKSSRQVENAVSMESRMVNGSFQSLYNTVRAELAKQGKQERVPPNAFSYVSKLTKLLRSSVGGNCYMACICTASPSSYSIGETVSTIKYGQKLRSLKNFPKPREALSFNLYQVRLEAAEREAVNLSKLTRVLAKECKSLKDSGEAKQPDDVWQAVTKIASSSQNESISDLIVFDTGDGQTLSPAEKKRLQIELQTNKATREKAEMKMRDYQSDVVSLRSENEILKKERERIEAELNDTKREVASLSNQNEELESALRTSEFREREAVGFLRQFRSFYVRLMKNKAAQGNGDVRQTLDDASRKIPGVADLGDILDVDQLMVQSGLLEKSEVGDDSNTANYVPSEHSMMRSKEEAEKAEKKELEVIKKTFGEQDLSAKNLTGVKRLESGMLSAYRQKLVESPAGKLAIQKESELEEQLIELSNKYISLQEAVTAEKALVEALSGRQGALGKLKSAQEMNGLRSELERKSNDLQAIIYKMNELHLVNKTMTEKVESREQQLTYLEEHLIDLQGRNRRLVIERQEGEKRLRQEKTEMKQQLDGMQIKLWQFDEDSPKTTGYWKLILPCAGEQVDLHSVPMEQRDTSNLAEEAARIIEMIPKDEVDEEDTKAFLESKAAIAEAQKTAAPTPLKAKVQIQPQSPIRVKPNSPPRSPLKFSAAAAAAEAPKAPKAQTSVSPSPQQPEKAALPKPHSPKPFSPQRLEPVSLPKQHSPKESKELSPPPKSDKASSRVSSVRARMAMWEKGGGAAGSGEAAPAVPPAFASSANRKFRPSTAGHDASGLRKQDD
ncbi:unnamed protein product [Cylindrotheca closterium]|uniref:Kinesin motor domain-containing protein n=1 Tax=Cylindrotheca closterium TaxID=2856 RepID=A0AAD2CUG1_9STRA|nr:unnamed protein product [Cylindrotheca closterium]